MKGYEINGRVIDLPDGSVVDKTLSKSGQAADAKVVGVKLADIDKNKPSVSGTPTVGQLLRVTSVSEDGKWTVEPVDAPDLSEYVKNTDYASASKAGVVAVSGTYNANVASDGKIRANKNTLEEYNAKSDYAFIGKATLENIKESLVKSVVDKPWKLKGTITTGNKSTGVNVDLSGCTEMIIIGNITGTDTTWLRVNDAIALVNGICANAQRTVKVIVNDGMKGYEATAKYYNSYNAPCLGSNLTAYDNTNGVYVQDIEKLYFSSPNIVTDCNLEIYAR